MEMAASRLKGAVLKKFLHNLLRPSGRHPVDKGLRAACNPCASLNLGYDI